MPIRDEDGHRAMQAAGKAWKAIKTSGAKTWREWTEVIGPGLVNARAEAQSISNASSGKGYNAAMGALLEETCCLAPATAVQLLQTKIKNPTLLETDLRALAAGRDFADHQAGLGPVTQPDGFA